jgi:hypothetical protein
MIVARVFDETGLARAFPQGRKAFYQQISQTMRKLIVCNFGSASEQM